MRVLISGTSGMIGSALTKHLAHEGCEVVRLVRRPPREPSERLWNPERAVLDAAAFAGVAAVVHLAGASIAAHRWSEARKEVILQSRSDSTRLLSETIARLESPPHVLISASGINAYGDQGDTLLDDTSPPAAGDDFLSTVCREWEGATAAASAR